MTDRPTDRRTIQPISRSTNQPMDMNGIRDVILKNNIYIHMYYLLRQLSLRKQVGRHAFKSYQ